MTVVSSIIVAMLLYAVGLMSVRSNRVAAKVFMFVAIGWILVTSFAIPPVIEHHGCTEVTYSDTPMAVVVSVVFWSMLTVSIIILTKQHMQNKKVIYKIEKPESKKDEYYDDEL